MAQEMGAGLGKCEVLLARLPERPAANCFDVEGKRGMSVLGIVLGDQLSLDLARTAERPIRVA